jgi:hypothetical protein
MFYQVCVASEISPHEVAKNDFFASPFKQHVIAIGWWIHNLFLPEQNQTLQGRREKRERIPTIASIIGVQEVFQGFTTTIEYHTDENN